VAKHLSSIAAFALAAAISPANADQFDPMLRPQAQKPIPAVLNEGGFTLAPMGFIRFCLQNPGDCAAIASAPVTMTPERAAELEHVNAIVNSRITPRSDTAGQDVWSLDVTAGDCDDYAAQKRHELIARGWPASALLFAAVVTPRGENHLIVVARTDRGEVVLDNLRSQILPADRTGYHWIKMQSAQTPNYWVEVKPAPMLVAQARGERRRFAARIQRPVTHAIPIEVASRDIQGTD
jgi:predicted transglutaminase-like cysteine proteinase